MNWIDQLLYAIASLWDRWRNRWHHEQRTCTHCEPILPVAGIDADVLFEAVIIGHIEGLRYEEETPYTHLLDAAAITFTQSVDRLFLNGVVVDVGQKDGFAVRWADGTATGVYLIHGAVPEILDNGEIVVRYPIFEAGTVDRPASLPQHPPFARGA